ncbi:xanthine dehydrogenase molybdopterin binding subunit [Shewanella sp.]|uniref:xanthine dehydrogenase molybdopterin binding subunit n=1 Tax=Shewanella sp. TaxID=50422 RepID=UPI003A96FD60
MVAEQRVSQVGKAVKHESAAKQVTGEALFTDDYAVPVDCLHAAVITSSIAHGSIDSYDFSEVEQAAGVVKLLTYQDIPGKNDIGAIFPGDPVLSDGEIKYHAQPIALVLARSHQQAWQAALKAKVSYCNTAAAVVDYAHARDGRTVRPSLTMGEPLSEAQLQRSDLVLESHVSVGGQEHFYLEGQVSLAQPTEDGGIFLRCSTQSPTDVQEAVAEVLGLPFNLVTVDMRRMGGGFGGKETNAGQWACLASLGALVSGRTVKLRLPRFVDMSVTGKRHPFYDHLQLGVSHDGIIESAKIELNALCGHSPDLSPSILSRAMFHSDNAYSLGHASITGHHLLTDTVSQTAFRGFGGPQGMVGIEKAMQDLSIRLGQDALDLRLKNLYRPGRDVTPYKMPVEQADMLRDIVTQLESSANYRGRRVEIEAFNRHSPVIKKGLALTPVKFGIAFTATHMNQAGALIHIFTDGSVQVSHGGTEMGQGLHTKVQQIVADTLGVPLAQILVTSTRTDKVPNTSPTAASSGADLNGMAAHNAALTLKQRLLEFAKQHYQLAAEPQLYQGELRCGEFSLSWNELVRSAFFNRVGLSATGFYKTPKIWFDVEKSEGHPFFYFSLGAACSEVSIDTLTGEMKVEQVDILFDAGNSLNPAVDLGQIEGGFIQGMGWLTNEELLWDQQGVLLSNSPMNYKIPSIGDYPNSMNIQLYDKPNPEYSVYRSKAVGEPPFMLAISLWCAIYDAIASLSEHQLPVSLDVPATGEKILAACMQQQLGSNGEDEQRTKVE